MLSSFFRCVFTNIHAGLSVHPSFRPLAPPFIPHVEKPPQMLASHFSELFSLIVPFFIGWGDANRRPSFFPEWLHWSDPNHRPADVAQGAWAPEMRRGIGKVLMCT